MVPHECGIQDNAPIDGSHCNIFCLRFNGLYVINYNRWVSCCVRRVGDAERVYAVWPWLFSSAYTHSRARSHCSYCSEHNKPHTRF